MSDTIDIVMSGPGKNALSTTLMADLLARLARADGRPLLVTGANDSFSTGLDLAEVAGLDQSGIVSLLDTFETLLETLYSYPAPTVAYINGHAIAGGCLVALCCDHRVVRADPRLKIGLNEVALGVCFPPLIQQLVKRRVPRRHLDEVVLGAHLFDPESALRVGLVDEVADDAETAARARLELLASYSREAYATTKADFRGVLATRPEARERFARESSATWTAPEFKAKLNAFLKR